VFVQNAKVWVSIDAFAITTLGCMHNLNTVHSIQDGIPGRGWIIWFQNMHLDLALRKLQGLETTKARWLCLEAIDNF
jgi:hypothetical protein